VILKSETYNFHRLDLTRQAGFIVTIYDEDGLRLAATMPCSTPAEAFAEARKIVDGKVVETENIARAAAAQYPLWARSGHSAYSMKTNFRTNHS